MKLCPLCDTAYPNHHTNCDADGATLVLSQELEPGTVIRNKYRIVRVLGRGGMGTVYLADHILLRRQRALKFISSQLGNDPRLLKRFRMEAQAAIELRHPNVAEVVDLDQAEDGCPYIAMEYVEGRDLRHVINDGPMAVERVLQIVRGVALGLGAAHAKGIIHRDVKPENVLIATGSGRTETPKLLDFGIAAMKENTTEMSSTRGLMLTPMYAAPEQWMGLPSEQLDGRTDLYALGGVLHEMLTGQTCFHPHSSEGWMYQHLQGERKAPSLTRTELRQWPGLDALVLRLLAQERDDRPRDVAEFLRDLDGVTAQRSGAYVETLVERNGGPRVETVAAPESRPVVAVVEKAARKTSHSLRWAIGVGVFLIAGLLAVAGARIFGKTNKSDKNSETASLAAGTIRENSRDGLKYVWIPAGSFEIGCSPGDSECREDEKPAHHVTISKSFWMGQTPVTVLAWKRYADAMKIPSLPTSDTLGRTNWNTAGPDDMPVVMVTWEQAFGYCQWAGMKLPTEAQWEYAARAGTEGPRYGDLNAIAWYGNNSGDKPIDAAQVWKSVEPDLAAYQQRLKENGNFIHAVRQKQPNPWQLYDMLGNVLEWTADWYGPNYYQSSPNEDPTGEPSGATKVVRAGSWSNIPEWVRASHRYAIAPSNNPTGVGFRCVGNL